MVEIAPKPKTKPKRVTTILFVFALILLILTGVAYFGLKSVGTKKQEELKKLQDHLAQQKTPLKQLENKLQRYKTKLDDLSLVLDSRLVGTKFFGFLERIVHKRVMLGGVKVDLNKGTVEINGEAESLPVLTQQLIFLKTVPEIKSFKLTNMNLQEDGKVSFTLILTLSSNLFK